MTSSGDVLLRGLSAEDARALLSIAGLVVLLLLWDIFED
jgi:hypothetical protein